MANPYATQGYLNKVKIALRDLAYVAEMFALQADDNTEQRDIWLNKLLDEIKRARELLK